MKQGRAPMVITHPLEGSKVVWQSQMILSQFSLSIMQVGNLEFPWTVVGKSSSKTLSIWKELYLLAV